MAMMAGGIAVEEIIGELNVCMPRGFPEVEPSPHYIITDCGGGSTSSGKALVMHTLNSPLISSAAGPPAIMAFAPSVVLDVLFGMLPNLVHSCTAANSASSTSRFILSWR